MPHHDIEPVRPNSLIGLEFKHDQIKHLVISNGHLVLIDFLRHYGKAMINDNDLDSDGI